MCSGKHSCDGHDQLGTPADLPRMFLPKKCVGKVRHSPNLGVSRIFRASKGDGLVFRKTLSVDFKTPLFSNKKNIQGIRRKTGAQKEQAIMRSPV